MHTNREKPQRQQNIIHPCPQIHLQRADRVRAALARRGYEARSQLIGGVAVGRVTGRAVSK